MPNLPKLNVSRMPPLLSSSSTGPDFHHFSSQNVFGVFRVFLYCLCPLIIYFLKILSQITSLLCTNPPMSSHLTQKYIPSLCSNDALFSEVFPQMPHIIQQYLPPPVPSVYLFQKSPNPFILPFPLQGTYVFDYLLFVLFLFLNISCL